MFRSILRMHIPLHIQTDTGPGAGHPGLRFLSRHKVTSQHCLSIPLSPARGSRVKEATLPADSGKKDMSAVGGRGT